MAEPASMQQAKMNRKNKPAKISVEKSNAAADQLVGSDDEGNSYDSPQRGQISPDTRNKISDSDENSSSPSKNQLIFENRSTALNTNAAPSD